MKYLIPLNEKFSEFNLSPRKGSEQSPLNREEILAIIDVAQEEDDWLEVERLLGVLKGVDESLVLGWNGYELLLENVQEAKGILQKLANDELRKAAASAQREEGDEPGEEATARRQEAEERLKERVNAKYFGPDSDFEKIKQMLNFQGPVAAFVRFRYNQRASFDVLESLHRLMTTTLKDYVNQLPMTVDEYSKMPYNPEGVGQGWEQLGDALNELLELQGGNWLISKLPKDALRTLIARGLISGVPVNLREEFKKAPREFQIEIQKEAAKLNAFNKPLLIKAFLHKLPTNKSIQDVLDALKTAVKNAGDTDRTKLLEIAMSNFPSVVVLHDSGDHMVFSFRNDSQLPTLCAKAQKWCIQPSWYNKGYADQFWSYATGTLQIGIIDFSVDNNYHTVGVTINPNGSVKALCNQPDHCTSGGNYRSVLQGFECGSDGRHSYPKELIQSIEENFDQELSIKKQTDTIYKKIKGYSTGEREYEEALTKTFIGLVRDMQSFMTQSTGSTDDIKANSDDNIVKRVIAAEVKNLKASPALKKVQQEYINKYSRPQGSYSAEHKPSVLPSAPDVNIFATILEDSPFLTISALDQMIQFHKASREVIEKHIKNLEGQETSLAKRIRVLFTGLGEAILALETLKEKLKK
jgi:hypothetical protein